MHSQNHENILPHFWKVAMSVYFEDLADIRLTAFFIPQLTQEKSVIMFYVGCCHYFDSRPWRSVVIVRRKCKDILIHCLEVAVVSRHIHQIWFMKVWTSQVDTLVSTVVWRCNGLTNIARFLLICHVDIAVVAENCIVAAW